MKKIRGTNRGIFKNKYLQTVEKQGLYKTIRRPFPPAFAPHCLKAICATALLTIQCHYVYRLKRKGCRAEADPSATPMHVYILKSHLDSTRHYTGSTTNIKKRLEEHNAGKSIHTAKYRPWSIKNAFWFDSPNKAIAFERYLKTGSGRAFTLRHF